MSFTEELLLRLIDTGLLGLVLLAAGYILNRLLEKYRGQQSTELETFKHHQSEALETFKGQQDREIEVFKARLQEETQATTQVALSRLPAYRKLWELSESVSPTVEVPISPEQAQALEAALRRWYYQEGDGIFLSLEAGRKFMSARRLLAEVGTREFQAIQDAFSALRTQLKTDLGVYGPADTQVDIST